MKRKGFKKYTKEAEAYLLEKWGVHRPWQIVGAINRLLDDTKTFENITLKARHMGLDTIKDAYNIITIKDVCSAFNYTNANIFKSWGLPCERFDKDTKYYYVDIKKFWKWAYDNREKINFKKYEMGSLLPEPKWLIPYRKEQKEKDRHAWTEQEEAALKLYKKHGKTNAYIAAKLGIEEKKVYEKVRNLKRYKATDLTAHDKKNKSITEEQKEKIRQLRKTGLSYRKIAAEADCNYSHVRRLCTKEAIEQGEGAKDE